MDGTNRKWAPFGFCAISFVAIGPDNQIKIHLPEHLKHITFLETVLQDLAAAVSSACVLATVGVNAIAVRAPTTLFCLASALGAKATVRS